MFSPIPVLFVMSNSLLNLADGSLKTLPNSTTYDLSDHTMVTNSNVFPYMAAILDKSRYLCAGALIDESWVLTVADSVFLYRDNLRLLHVRLGSKNNKKGGELLPIKLIEFHPLFDDQKPEYDVALVKLSQKVRFTPSLNPIRVQKKAKKMYATHFIVTAWPTQRASSSEIKEVLSMEAIERRRTLQVSHLHPTKPKQCAEVLEDMGLSKTNLMCLDQGEGTDTCSREVGAPVVFNGILWGILSSWVSDDCDLLPSPSFVTLVAAPNISTWIYATRQGMKWHQRLTFFELLDYDDFADDD